MKLHTISFGCQMSVADSEEMTRPWLARGGMSTAELAEADAVILNTCTVRQHAEDRAISMIGRLRTWKEERPERFLIVAGCAAERLGPWIQQRFPYVDLVVGAKAIEDYPKILEQALSRRFDWRRENEGLWPQTRDRATPSPVSAYVTIMRGCNYSCSYCIVPSVRGREVYRPFEKILAEIRERALSGAREVVLLGQTVNSYRDPASGRDFADLLRAADALGSIERIRFMSPHPFFLNERMMRAMAECSRVCPHLHLPAQSGSDRILKAMRRNYSRSDFLNKVETLRRFIPDLALTTDFIVGFPEEEDADFQKTLSLARESDVCSAYCFKYSARQGTQAENLPDVPDEVKEERLKVLLETVDRLTRRHLDKLHRRKVAVLLETATDGRTRHYFKARLETPGTPGETVDAEVVGATATALRARTASLA